MSNVGLSQVNFDVGLQDDEERQLEKEDEERERELHELLSKELTDDFSDDENVSFSFHASDTSAHRLSDPAISHPSYGETLPLGDIEEPRELLYYKHAYPSSTHNDHVIHDDGSYPRGYNAAGGSSEGNGYHGDNDAYQDGGGGDHVAAYHGSHGYASDDVKRYYGDGDDGGGTGYLSNERDQNFNTYKVRYKRSVGADDVTDGGDDVMMAVEGPGSELAQLRILYEARSRKLQELQDEMARREKDYEKQIRLLNHHLALGKGEREGLSCSLKHIQEVATERKNECEKLEAKLQESHLEMEQNLTDKHQIQGELEGARKTIESLHQQLMELEKSESLSRAREQHENVVMATRKRYEEEIVRLKQKIDDINNSLVWKNEESGRLQDELACSRKENDRLRLDRADTVNRLTKCLEDSQKRNEDLLNSGSTQEITLLQGELQRSQRENEQLLKHNKTMENDITDLKEQLRIHESVSNLGLTTKNSSPPSTLEIRRNFAADDWKTPKQNSSPNIVDNSEDKLIVNLKEELHNSLSLNTLKRQELDGLRTQLDNAEKDAAILRNEKQRCDFIIDNLQKTVSEQEKRLSELAEFVENPDKKIQYYQNEMNKLNNTIEENRENLEQSMKEIKKLEEINSSLKSQMSEMVEQHDTDKQKSVEQCRQSCLEFHDEAIKTLKKQLNDESEEEILKLRNELDHVTSELSQAKDSYVALSEESRWLEKQTREQCEEETRMKLIEAQEEWSKQRDFENEKMRQELMTELEQRLSQEKISWQKTQDDITTEKVKTELALAKVNWEKEKQYLVQNAFAKAENKRTLLEGDTNNFEIMLAEEKTKWQCEKDNEITKLRCELENRAKIDLEQHLDDLTTEWTKAKAAEIERKLCQARESWEKDINVYTSRAVDAAKADWLKHETEVRRQAVDEAITSAKEEWERVKQREFEELLKREKELWQSTADEQRTQAIDTALLLAEEKWRSDHVDKTSEAVRDALEQVRITWDKERDTAIETAVTQSLRSAKEEWNKNKLREIEQVLTAARKQWLNEFDILKINTSTSPVKDDASSKQTSDTNKAFAFLEAQYSRNLKEFRETELKKAFEQSEKNQSVALKKQQESHEKQLEAVTKIAQEDLERELKEVETAYQSKLQAIVTEMEGKWAEKSASLEEDWNERLRQVEVSREASVQEARVSVAKEIRAKYEARYENARKKLDLHYQERLESMVERAKHDWEAEQEEERLALEEQHVMKMTSVEEKLRKELTTKAEEMVARQRAEARIERENLEIRMNEEKQNNLHEVEHLRGQLAVKSLNTRSCQTEFTSKVSGEGSEGSKLHELRREYLKTTAQLKTDMQDHVITTRKNAAKTIRTEVMKERHATAKRLRKYYLECLKELLENDKNTEATLKNEEKLKMMEERLKLPDEKQDLMTANTDKSPEHVRLSDGGTTPSDSRKPPSTRSPSRVTQEDNETQVHTTGDFLTRVIFSRATPEVEGISPYREKEPPGECTSSSSESLFRIDTAQPQLPLSNPRRPLAQPLRSAVLSESDSSSGRSGTRYKSNAPSKTGSTLKNVSTRDRPRASSARERARNEKRFNGHSCTQAPERPTKLVTSARPIADVLPSKPLSPIKRASPKYAYTLHTHE